MHASLFTINNGFRMFIFLFLLLVLAACSSTKSPESIVKDFQKIILDGDYEKYQKLMNNETVMKKETFEKHHQSLVRNNVKFKIDKKYEFGKDILMIVDSENWHHVFQKIDNKYVYLGVDVEDYMVRFKPDKNSTNEVTIKQTDQNSVKMSNSAGLELLNKYRETIKESPEAVKLAEDIYRASIDGFTEDENNSIDRSILSDFLSSSFSNGKYEESLKFARLLTDSTDSGVLTYARYAAIIHFQNQELGLALAHLQLIQQEMGIGKETQWIASIFYSKDYQEAYAKVGKELTDIILHPKSQISLNQVMSSFNNRKELEKTANQMPTEIHEAAVVPESAFQEIKQKFVTDFKITKNPLYKPISYDLNNDGSNEVIMAAGFFMEDMVDMPGVIAVYDPSTLKLIGELKDISFGPHSIWKLKNPKFGNVLAVVSGYRSSQIDIFTLSSGILHNIGNAGSEVVGDPVMGGNFKISDVNGDGFDEIIADEMDWKNSKTMRDAKSITYIYSWDPTKLRYEKQVFNGSVSSNKPDSTSIKVSTEVDYRQFEGTWSTPGTDELMFTLKFTNSTSGIITFYGESGYDSNYTAKQNTDGTMTIKFKSGESERQFTLKKISTSQLQVQTANRTVKVTKDGK